MKKIVIILILLCLFISGILIFYYKGDRNSFLNRTINNFSAAHPEIAINLKKSTKILDAFYLFHQLIPDKIPTYSLFIKGNDLIKLNINLPISGHLTQEYKKYVPAEFIYQGKAYKVKVRYRGDNPNHWKFNKKSWRIKFNDEFEGQESINLILPEDRYFFIEPWISRMGQKLGLVTPELSFVKLIINDLSQGVYLKSEQWSEKFLVNHGLSEDADLYGEAEFDEPVPNLYADVSNFKKYTFDSSKPEEDVSRLATLLDLLHDASDQEFFEKIPDLVDMDNFLLWQTQATLAFSHSQKKSHNLIAYFNPEIDKFQFIPWNVAMADEKPIYPDINYNPLMTRVLKNPDYMFKRNQILWEYISNQDNLVDDLDYFDSLYQTTRGAFYRDSIKIFPNFDFDLTVKKHRRRIVIAQNRIKELLNDTQVETSVNLNPDFEPSALAYIEIESRGFASLGLNQIILKINQTPVTFSLIKDVNNNRKIDQEDERISRFVLDNFQSSINPENILIHTHRNIQEYGQPFLLEPTKQGFFITSDQSVKISQIDVLLNNAITKQPVKN